MSDPKYPVKRNGEYTLYIEKLAFGGAGVARLDNYVIFVKGALPGETVRARIRKRKTAYAEARLLEIEQSSPLRQKPPCPYFEWCGGCAWQNMQYADQLRYKQDIVRESLKHIGGMDDVAVLPVLASDREFAYRNKMEFSFSDRRWLTADELGDETVRRDFALGLHVPGTFDKIIQVNHCMLQSERANRVLQIVSEFSQREGLQPYGVRSHEGFLRFLVLRESAYDGGLMVNIVTAYEQEEPLKKLADILFEQVENIAGVVNNINTRKAQIAVGEKEILLRGLPYIQEKLGPFVFQISANSFFQTNTRQAERLYDTVMTFSELQGREVVWDLYSGTGTISMFLARRAAQVIGFELAESAVADAAENARQHEVYNARFVGGDLLHRLEETEPKPDVLVTDPPRAGMHEKVVRYINKIAPRRIVYVSCNPTTLARDLAILTQKYRVDTVQPVDMFPQTYHIETVVKLSLKQEK